MNNTNHSHLNTDISNTPELLPMHTELFVYANKYLEWLAITSHSEKTIINRRCYLKYFCFWCKERSISSLVALDSKLAYRYQKSLHYAKNHRGKSLTVNAQQGRLIALKVFCKWLYKQGYKEENVTEEMVLRYNRRKLPGNYLNTEEIDRILFFTDTKTEIGLRDRAMLEALYSSGLRRAELLNLRLHNINRNQRTIHVENGKGGKDRIIPIGERALYWMDKYIHEVRTIWVTHDSLDYLFIGRKGSRLSEQYLGNRVKKYLIQAGIEKSGSCHLFRHSMATTMLENGADIRFVQQMLGHADLSSTQIYTHVSVSKLQEVHEKTHPAKLRRKSDNTDSSNEESVKSVL